MSEIVSTGYEESADLAGPVESEQQRVVNWRLHELLRAGYDIPAAEMIAARIDIDLHIATGLLAHGCPAGVARRILL